jgi:hypothetical protein
MAFDEGLAERVREVLGADPSISERTMFGGLCFLTDGNMCFAILGNELLVRVGPDGYATALHLPNAREMDLTGRPMGGMVVFDPEGLAEDGDLAAWLERGRSFAGSLPPRYP